MKHLTFSEVKRAHSLLRFLWPVQSRKQAVMMAVVYAVGLPSMALSLHLLDPREPTWFTMLGCVLGSTWGLFIHLPGTLVVTTRGEARHFVGEVSDLLRRYGYHGERCGCGVHFAGRPPSWYPNWLRFAESEIDLVAKDHVIVLRGPKFVLRHLRRRWELDVVGPSHA